MGHCIAGHWPYTLSMFARQGVRVLTLALSLVALSSSPQAAADSSDGAIRLELVGFDGDEGVAMCALYTPENWLKPGKGQSARAIIRDGKATCVFKRVRFGSYGLAAYHDEDSDAVLDTVLGIPSEAYCFSNDARAPLGPPAFESAKFRHRSARTLQRCRVR